MTFDEAFLAVLRAQGLLLSDAEMERARSVARSVSVAMLKEAAEACDMLTMALDHGGNALRREATASQCATTVRAIIQQVQGEGN